MKIRVNFFRKPLQNFSLFPLNFIPAVTPFVRLGETPIFD
jgi:hypothetical protein